MDNTKILYFIFTDLTEVFYVSIRIINFISFQIVFWYFVYHVFIFFSPALFQYEYKYLIFFLRMSIFFFIISIFLSNYLLIPLTGLFFLSFKPFAFSTSIFFEARLIEFTSFYITTYCFCMVYCQVFSVLIFFFRNVHSKKYYITIKKFRKLYYFIFVIFSTLVSPPEILSQVLASVVIAVIYELFLLCNLCLSVLSKLIRQ